MKNSRIDQTKIADAVGQVDIATGMVGRRIFVDDDIYRIELDRIFGRCWLYLGHESQIPNPGDFIGVNMGETPILVARDRQGKIGAVINSCRHRGSAVCRADKGNAKSFVCPYHGWTYDTQGKLISVPGEENLYRGKFKREDWGLAKVAKVDSYLGLIFGCFDPEAPSLEEYLGDMRWGLDLLLMQGDYVAVPGVARWVMDVNWKIAADNAIGDMYHGVLTHRSAVLAGHTRATGSNMSDKIVMPDNSKRKGMTVVTEYGHGFNANFPREGELNMDAPLAYWRKDPAVQKRMGPIRGNVSRANMNVFPNLFVNSGSRELMLRNPIGPTKMEIWKTILVDRSASPEIQRQQVRASNRHFGPAGMYEQDDGENWDQATKASTSNILQRYDFNYAMGVGDGEIVAGRDGSPPRVETLVNEHAQLWMYRCWAEYLKAENWDDLRRNHSRPEGRL